MSATLTWYVARAGGIVAWALATASVIWGLAFTSGALGARPRPAWLFDLHRFLGGLALVFTAVHVLAVVADSYVRFTLVNLLVPHGPVAPGRGGVGRGRALPAAGGRAHRPGEVAAAESALAPDALRQLRGARPHHHPRAHRRHRHHRRPLPPRRDRLARADRRARRGPGLACAVEVEDRAARGDARSPAPAVDAVSTAGAQALSERGGAELDAAEPARPLVEVVVPVYNEERVLAASVTRLHDYLSGGFPFAFRITVADNASTDPTWFVARQLAARLPKVRAVRLDQRGRGGRSARSGAAATPTWSPTWTWTCPPGWRRSCRWSRHC
jgi:hypothetical protein